jgi:S1-C subfamily serine protease
LLLVSGGGVALLAVIGLIAALTSAGTNTAINKETEKKASKAQGPGTLVLDWPEGERGDAALTIDGEAKSVPTEGPISFKLKPRQHTVGILRKGFEPVRGQVEVAKGATARFQPQWKPAADVAGIATADKSSQISSFQVGSAIVIPGFEGWQQVLAVAKDKAAAQKKDILIVFGSSDGNPATVELAKALKAAGLPNGPLGERFIPLVIDQPQTDSGLNRVLDYRQNRKLSGEYAVGEELPMLALADDQGRPYAIQRQWPEGVAAAERMIQTLAAQKQDRDARLAAAAQGTPQEQLAAAVDFLNWLAEKKLLVQYRDAIHPWWTLAVQEDPTNASCKLEVVLEAEMMCKLTEIPDDPGTVDIVQRLDLLQPWLQDRRFADADRGFKLHFLAGNILGRIGEDDSAIAHITRAATYDPKDPDLQDARKALAGLSRGVLSSGTGFLIADGGYILTNKHVVEGPGRVAVQLAGVNEPIVAQSVKLHPKLDIALVQVDLPQSHRPDALGINAANLSLGLEVGALGYPLNDLLGEGLKFTEGVVSSLPNAGRKDMILLDMRINFGNSGGPLCDKQGNVIGMITAKIGDAGDASFGMAIPAESLDAFLTEELPSDAKRGACRPTIPNSTWPDVTKAISPAVLMIVKLR